MRKVLVALTIVAVLFTAFSAFAQSRRRESVNAIPEGNLGGEIDRGQNQNQGDSRYWDVHQQSGGALFNEPDSDQCPAFMEYVGSGLPLF